jgi:hypothetical protein
MPTIDDGFKQGYKKTPCIVCRTELIPARMGKMAKLCKKCSEGPQNCDNAATGARKQLRDLANSKGHIAIVGNKRKSTPKSTPIDLSLPVYKDPPDDASRDELQNRLCTSVEGMSKNLAEFTRSFNSSQGTYALQVNIVNGLVADVQNLFQKLNETRAHLQSELSSLSSTLEKRDLQISGLTQDISNVKEMCLSSSKKQKTPPLLLLTQTQATPANTVHLPESGRVATAPRSELVGWEQKWQERNKNKDNVSLSLRNRNQVEETVQFYEYKGGLYIHIKSRGDKNPKNRVVAYVAWLENRAKKEFPRQFCQGYHSENYSAKHDFLKVTMSVNRLEHFEFFDEENGTQVPGILENWFEWKKEHNV